MISQLRLVGHAKESLADERDPRMGTREAASESAGFARLALTRKRFDEPCPLSVVQ